MDMDTSTGSLAYPKRRPKAKAKANPLGVYSHIISVPMDRDCFFGPICIHLLWSAFLRDRADEMGDGVSQGYTSYSSHVSSEGSLHVISAFFDAFLFFSLRCALCLLCICVL